MIKKMETTCYETICYDYKVDTGYDYCILSIAFLLGVIFICNI